MNTRNLIRLAIKAANAGPHRQHRVGAAAIRGDGVLVSASNGQTFGTLVPKGHAETRLLRKLDSNSIVCVVRVKADGSLAIAKPCQNCMQALRSKHVSLVYFTDVDGSIKRISL